MAQPKRFEMMNPHYVIPQLEIWADDDVLDASPDPEN